MIQIEICMYNCQIKMLPYIKLKGVKGESSNF